MQPSNPNQFTEKAWEAIAQTQDVAKAARQQQIETEHLMKAMLDQDGLATSILNKAEVSVQRVREATESFIKKQPKVSGNSDSVYLGRSMNSLLDRAESYRKEYQDDYISIEHLILGYLKDDRFGKSLFQEFKLDENRLKLTIADIRGNQKVTDQNPEGKYQALEKY
ncbi:MAG: ATP-dependent chaperone ClpB, partial [Moorea sp. SIO4E2]